MKKGLLFAMFVSISVGLFAQKGERKESVHHSVETNRFGSNWFISAGIGGQMYLGGSAENIDFGKRLAPALDVAVGKWFTPGLGVRFSYNGLQVKSASRYADAPYTIGGQYSNGDYKQKWNVANIHGDILLNLSNMIGGYNESRLYSFIPYVGLGVVSSRTSPIDYNLGVNLGLINRFRLSSALDFNVELRGVMTKGAFEQASKSRIAGLTVGLTYKFNKRGWKPVSVAPMIPESQLVELQSKVSELKNENEILKRDLVAARNQKPEVIVKKEAGFVPRLVVLFNINKSVVSKREYMNIESMAKGIKANPDKVFTICGYADKGTGSAAYNLKLSKKRAEAVRDIMINDFSVTASQLKVEYKGGVDSLFYGNSTLSRVAIVEE